MLRKPISTPLARLRDALADLVRGATDALLPPPEPRRIPVRVKDRR